MLKTIVRYDHREVIGLVVMPENECSSSQQAHPERLDAVVDSSQNGGDEPRGDAVSQSSRDAIPLGELSSQQDTREQVVQFHTHLEDIQNIFAHQAEIL
jgi:hypothetical protein